MAALIALGAIWTGTAMGQVTPPQPEPDPVVQTDDDGNSSGADEWTTMGIAVAAVAVVILLLAFAARIYIRWSEVTDPYKLAMTDPWIRANLDRWQAAQGADQSENPPATPVEAARNSRGESQDGTH